MPCLVLAPDDLSIITVNEAVPRVTGMRRSDLVGRRLFDVFPGAPDDSPRARLHAALMEALRTRETTVVPVLRYDIPASDDPSRNEERWWSQVIAPVLGDGGEVDYLIVQVEDVTPTAKALGGGATRRDAAKEQAETIERLRASNLALARESELRRRTEEQVRRTAELDAFRVRLADALREHSDPVAAGTEAARLLAQHLGADVAYFAEIDAEADVYVITDTFSRNGRASVSGRYDVATYGELSARLGRGETLVVEDVETDPDVGDTTRRAMLSHGLWSFVTAPLVEPERWAAILNVLCGTPRRWRPDEVALVEGTAQRTWAVVERLKAEQQLRHNAETLKSLVVNSPFGVYVVDADLRIVHASPTALRMFGIEPLVGTDLAESLGAIWTQPFAGEAAARFRRTLETGEPFTSHDMVQRRSDRDATEAYDWRLERITLPDGRPGVVCYYYDLTERRLLEELLRQREEELRRLNASLERQVAERTLALRRSEARFRQAFSAGPVAACIVTLDDDRLIEVNGTFERLTGYAAEDAVGRTAQELGLWSSAEDAAKIARALEADDGYRDLELKVVTKDGAVKDIIGSAARITWGEEPVRLKMFIDNTAAKRSQEQVNRAIKDVMSEAAWFSRNLVERLSRAGGPRQADDPPVDLTPREQQVLSRIALGMSDKAIAAELGVSHQTVRNHVARIYAKIKVHSRSQAIVWAREKGIPASAVAPL